MAKRELRNVFSASTDKGVSFEGTVSMAKQSHKAECDINNIMARYSKTGILPAMIRQNPTYGDFSDPVDYREGLHLVMRAQEQFGALPAAVRERFGNDPYKFLEFCSKKENVEEMATLGLLKEEAVKALEAKKRAKAEGAPPAEPKEPKK